MNAPVTVDEMLAAGKARREALASVDPLEAFATASREAAVAAYEHDAERKRLAQEATRKLTPLFNAAQVARSVLHTQRQRAIAALKTANKATLRAMRSLYPRDPDTENVCCPFAERVHDGEWPNKYECTLHVAASPRARSRFTGRLGAERDD